jgi:sugar (pentulose or hexulose) kinase
MACYLVLDVGTSSTKAAIVDENGLLLVEKSSQTRVRRPFPNWAEHDPQDWRQAVCDLAAALIRQLGNPSISAVCVSGQAPSCVPINSHGKPLRPAILWHDRRAAPQADWLRRTWGVQEGENTLDSYFGGVKWLWFRQNEPEEYEQTWKILQANSYIVYYLTGEAVIDPSQAGLCSPCFSLARRDWDDAACEKMGIATEKLPRVLPSWQVVGQVSASAARASGIPAGTPVLCGGGDFACACLGAGVENKSTAVMMLGTAGNLLVPSPLKPDPRLLNTLHVTGETLSLGGVMAGGVLNWFCELLQDNDPDLVKRLDEEPSLIPAGADRLVFLPSLWGERTPIWNPDARGVFLGLAAHHRREHLYRALLEGVAYAYRQMVEILNETGTSLDSVLAVNGGAKSPLWRQIFSDVLGFPVRWRPHNSGTVAGAAYLAALGAGDENEFGSILNWCEPAIETRPNAQNKEVYSERFQVFSQLYGRVKDLY